MRTKISAKEFREKVKHGEFDTSGKRITSKSLEPEFKSLINKGAFKQEKKTPYNKYKAKKTTYNGFTFDSKKEADYCRDLDYLKMAGKIEGYEKQYPFICTINDKKICTYKCDFKVIYTDRVEFIDVKGFRTPVFNLKKKMVEALFEVEIILK